jgi:hypothetical protein
MIKNIVGLFVGQDSKKRQMGFGMGIALSVMYFTDIINLELYEAIMPFVLLWTGAAFSAKLTKLSNAVKSAKK